MAGVNLPRRNYRSALRDQQAAVTRGAVLAAARELFLAQGYGATTLEQIAERAGVSKPTVFSAIGNKQEVLVRLWTVTLPDGDEDPKVAEREPRERVEDEPDPYQAVERHVGHLADLWSRYAELEEVVRGGASSGEPALREAWATAERKRLIAAQRFVDALADKRSLRDGLARDAAADIVWLLSGPENYRALVLTRGWSRARYERWLIDALTHALFPPPSLTGVRYFSSRTRSRHTS